jgi:hypothetical protein
VLGTVLARILHQLRGERNAALCVASGVWAAALFSAGESGHKRAFQEQALA